MKLTNYDDIVNGLVDMMASLDADNPEYQVDIYLYVDEEGYGVLDDFVNVGGNSWLNDDHICLYCRKHNYDSEYEGTTADELKSLYGDEYTETAWRCLEDAGIE